MKKPKITPEELQRLRDAFADAKKRGQFTPDPSFDNHTILGIRAMNGWFMVCDCIRGGDFPFVWIDLFKNGTLVCNRREFCDATAALLEFSRRDPRSFVEGFGREVLDQIEDWTARFYRWIDSSGVRV